MLGIWLASSLPKKLSCPSRYWCFSGVLFFSRSIRQSALEAHTIFICPFLWLRPAHGLHELLLFHWFRFLRPGRGKAGRSRELAVRRRARCDKSARSPDRFCLVRGDRILRFTVAAVAALDAPCSSGDGHHFRGLSAILLRKP